MSRLFSHPARLLFLPFAFSHSWAQTAAVVVPSGTYPPIVHMTTEQDHARTMYLLNMRLIRLGKDGDGIGDGRFPANYDEAKANPFPELPDPLILKGKKKEITSAKVWFEKRRPEIVGDFDREMYGRVPAKTPDVTWELKSTTEGFDGGIHMKIETLAGHVDNSAYPLINVDIQMVVTLPVDEPQADQPHVVPLILTFDRVASSTRYPATVLVSSMAPAAAGATWQHQILAHGWGYATLSTESIQPDNGAGLTEGIIGLCNHGQPRKLDDWGALRAWAWGASRALDYLATDPGVDAHQVGIEGHAHYGDAALVAMAYDQRFAVAYVSSSGEGGAKLSRRNFGEALENVTGSREYHLMAGNFVRYAGPLGVDDLPVDAHELIALCAPRPVFIGGGTTDGDGWVDTKGMFMAAVAAGPVYRLLGKKDLATGSFPATETSLISGDLAFRQHNGGHTPDPNWPTFLTFASRYLKTPPAGSIANRQIASSR